MTYSCLDRTDSARWTEISTDKAEYTWFEARGFVLHSIMPVPVERHIGLCIGKIFLVY